MSFTPTPISVAELSDRDQFCRFLGITHVDSGDGFAILEITLEDRHLNFLGACHGGVLFALADSAFGSACNATGVVSVGIDTHMAYIKGAKAGDVVRADARRVNASSKTEVYRANVLRGDEVLATFTGTVIKLPRHVQDHLLQAP